MTTLEQPTTTLWLPPDATPFDVVVAFVAGG
jgi:hypothetical protein